MSEKMSEESRVNIKLPGLKKCFGKVVGVLKLYEGWYG